MNNKFKELSFSKRGGNLTLNFNNYDYWESLDDILIILKDIYNVEVIEELDGPDSRIFFIKINEISYSLQYDSYGAFLKSDSILGDDFLKEIQMSFPSSLEQ